MAEHRLANGYVLTDEEIERRAEQWENSAWEGGLATVRAGRPPLSGEPNAHLSFKCPRSGADLIALAAKASGVNRSEFLRDAALEKAARVMAGQPDQELVNA